MNRKHFVIFLLVLIIGIGIISARGCPKRRKDKIGSSNEWTGIAAPSSLTATAFSSSEIRLSWQDNSNNEDGFEIESRQGGTTQYSLLATLSANTISYSDPGPFIPFTTYYYRVRAFNTIGDRSNWSNEASVNTDFVLSKVVPVDHTLGLTSDGTIWVWGNNEYGQLGLGDTNNRTIPTFLTSDFNWELFTDVETISAGFIHSIAKKTNGTLWSWGANGTGQLGTGDTESVEVPFQIGTDSDWSVFGAGAAHTIGIKNNRTIWVWGNNEFGQLGLGDSGLSTYRTTPSQVGTDSDWGTIAGGDFHTISLKTNRTIWSWGRNDFGQLGLGDYTNRLTPTLIGTESDWSVISAGEFHTIGIKTNCTIWAWGLNNRGQLGLSVSVYRQYTPYQIGTNSDWSMVTAAYSQTLSLKFNSYDEKDGTLWAWGSNEYGQLGLGHNTDRYTPTQIGTDSDWSIVTTGGVYGIYILKVGHSVAIKTNDTIWVWGNNAYGQLGLGDTFNRHIPYRLGSAGSPSSLTLQIMSSTQIDIAWIDNAYNEQGFKIERKIGRNGIYQEIGSTTANSTTYSDITPAGFAPNATYYYRVKAYNSYGESLYSNEAYTILSFDWAIIAGGDYHSLSIKTNGTLWAWGQNGFGQLGLGDKTTRNTWTQLITGTDSDWSTIAGGWIHTIALKRDGTMWTWGCNIFGQLGLGDNTERTTPTQIIIGTDSDWSMVTAGWAHNITLKRDGTIWTWGNNYYGQLGVGDKTNRITPSQIIIGTDSDWSAIAAGNSHAIASMNDGTLWSWGRNSYGQLGLGVSGDATNRTTPSQVGTQTDWSTIAVGDFHSITLKCDGTIWTCGYNDAGQLGLGDKIKRNTFSQVGIQTDWSSISGGYQHTLAIKTNRTLWSWGYNDTGQLGLGDNTDKTTPNQVADKMDWSAIAAGGYHTIISKQNGTLWVCGDNDYGQLGLGDAIDRNVPTLIGE